MMSTKATAQTTAPGNAPVVLKLNDKSNLRWLRNMIEGNLLFADNLKGLDIRTGNIRYEADGMSARIQLEVKVKDENGKVVSDYERDLKKYGFTFGLTEADLGRTFISRGEKFALAGVAMRRRKYPIVGKRVSDGKTLLFQEEIVKRLEPK